MRAGGAGRAGLRIERRPGLGDALRRRHPRIEAPDRILVDRLHLAPERAQRVATGPVVAPVLPAQLASLESLKPEQRTHQRALATARLADHAEAPARSDAQRHVHERGRRVAPREPAPRAVAHREFAGHEQRAH